MGDPPLPQTSIGCQELLGFDVLHSGFLSKKSKPHKTIKFLSKVIPMWNQRYAVIHDGCFYLFGGSRASKPTTAISLYGYNKVRRCTEIPASEAPNIFTLEPVQPVLKTFFLSAASPREAKKWMYELKRAMISANGKVPSLPTLERRGSADSSEAADFRDIEESIYTDAEGVQLPASIQQGRDDEEEDPEDYMEIPEEAAPKKSHTLPNKSRPLPSVPTGKAPAASTTPRGSKPERPPSTSSCRDRSPPPIPISPTSPTSKVSSATTWVKQQAGKIGKATPPKVATKPVFGGKAVLPGMPMPARPSKQTPSPGAGQNGGRPDRPPLPIPIAERSDDPDGQVDPSVTEDKAAYMVPKGDDTNLDWDQVYWADIDREGVTRGNQLLIDIGTDGAYLVRDGSLDGEYTLCVLTDGQPRKYRIAYNAVRDVYHIKVGFEFSTILDLLRFYHENELPNRPNSFLTMPYNV